jgi:predicted component of viral defense system (DUF524 family)
VSANPESCIIIPCAADRGPVVAHIRVSIFDRADPSWGLLERHPLIVLDNETASALGESPVQLRERARYEYRVEQDTTFLDRLVLMAERGIQRSSMNSQCGIIETGDFCGSLQLKLLREGDPEDRTVAWTTVEVRSMKIDYRTHYRGMLRFIEQKSAGLLLDARASTKLSLTSLWSRSSNIIEQQLEFLRSLLESDEFGIAIEQILRYPHRRLEEKFVERLITKSCKPNRGFARQFASAKIRLAIPQSHPLSLRFDSVPRSILVSKRIDDYDTPENRFVVMVIRGFRDFLQAVEAFLKRGRQSSNADSTTLLRHSKRLRRLLEQQLSRSFFPDILLPDSLPLASPVLQRKAGYREILRIWLQFHAAAQLTWDGGLDIFAAGSRNVATLYEYWLFFQLEELFRRKFNFAKPLHAILIDRSEGLPRLKLKRDVETVIEHGVTRPSHATRKLLATLYFNRRFASVNDHIKAGSWTRAVRPDYTLTIWPDGFDRDEAEAQELLVHIHFDAKYRVEVPRDLFGAELDSDTLSDDIGPTDAPVTRAKYQDLLKMHAYRDAVRRTAGAYVLYPGTPGDDQMFRGYHEILPGLGAFAVRPDKDGCAQGLSSFDKFIDDVLDHLASRTTARERVTYHVSESYRVEMPETRSAVALSETDRFFPRDRALPPAEHQVLVAWYDSPLQLEWTRQTGKAIVRLGERPGAWHIPPFLAEVRHVLLHTHGKHVEPGLWRLTKLGLDVYTADELKTKFDYPLSAQSQIYAVLDVEPDPNWQRMIWDADRLLRELQRFKSSQRRMPITTLGRLSAYPEVLPLANLLLATTLH